MNDIETLTPSKAAAQTATTGAGKPHYLVLDGLRGIAAVCVVLFHFSEMVIYDYSRLWIGHGFLAVDFFFCLSGFVLGYAYDDRIRNLGLLPFLKARLMRLHPLVVLGSVLGLAAFYANPFGIPPGYPAGRMSLIFLASVLLIPFGTMSERGQNLFGLNAPAWSLFWEYVANVVFALGLYRASRRTLVVLAGVAGLALGWAGAHMGNLAGGWSARNFWVGGIRVAFSFTAGLLVYRTGWRPRSRLGFGSLSALLVLAFVMPYTQGGWIREFAVITLYFPLLVALGAGTAVNPQASSPRVARLCTLSGDLSYPLYMTHYAVLWIWGDFAYKHHLADGHLTLPVLGCTLAMLVIAYAAMVIFDQPVRAFLRSRWA